MLPGLRCWDCNNFIKGDEMKFKVSWFSSGWIISPVEKINDEYYYVWKDLELHRASVGYDNKKHHQFGSAPGYYVSEKSAKYHLKSFKEKHNMADQVEITVKVNGVATPLHKISEQTLLTVRENSKPEEVPAFRICKADGVWPRLIVRLPADIHRHAGQFVMFDAKGNIINSGGKHSHDHYSYMRELRLNDIS